MHQWTANDHHSHGHYESALGEVARTCFLPCRFGSLLLNLQRPTDGTCFLRAQIEWCVLLAFCLLAGVRLLLLVVHSQDASDRLAHNLDLCKFRRSAASHLRDSKLRELTLHFIQVFHQLLGCLAAKFKGLDARHWK